MSSAREDPEVVTYRIPRIEVYKVTDDELRRIEDGFGQVGQDLTFAVASLSFCIVFAITLITAILSEGLFVIFLSLVVISTVVAPYTAPVGGEQGGLSPMSLQRYEAGRSNRRFLLRTELEQAAEQQHAVDAAARRR